MAFDRLKVEIFGASHSKSIGAVVQGLPSGFKVDLKELDSFAKRRLSTGKFTTPRKEEDKFTVTGLVDGKTSGKLTFEIENKNIKSSDYQKICTIPRPSHADYPCYIKYGKIFEGGGNYSGRMTAPLTLVGGVAKQMLESMGVKVRAYVYSIGQIVGKSYKDGYEKTDELGLDIAKAQKVLESAQKDGDSLGGTVECVVQGMPIGVGDALFSGLEGKIASNVFAIPAVKGIEFGEGFNISSMKGSEANDPIVLVGNKIKIKTNKAGGINGGMSNGEDITLKVAFRPTPSISKPQKSVDLKSMDNVELKIGGRHDVCFVPRAAVVVEAVVALSVLDSVLVEDLWKN